MGFSYSTLIDEIFALLPWDNLSEEETEKLVTATSLLVDRDDELSGHFATVIEGVADSTVIACAAGGVVVEFPRELPRIPRAIHVSVGDNASGAILNTVRADLTNTSFKVRVYDAAGVELVAGESIRVEWIAAL